MSNSTGITVTQAVVGIAAIHFAVFATSFICGFVSVKYHEYTYRDRILGL